ncbi:MAG: hypothetical protein B1H40_00125 [Candidatus Latescibacteria bacterium 4484_181]|nr:MAG: hypothetical protein B1H40_00125 [Candidatus Latescibacteria bacterium 4484_181]
MKRMLLSTLTWIWRFKKMLILYILMSLSIIWSCSKPPPSTLEEFMLAFLEGMPQDQVLAFLEDMPQDQGQWSQYQMELNDRLYQYQREESARQAQEYRELLRNQQPESCRQGGSYGHEGEPRFYENY